MYNLSQLGNFYNATISFFLNLLDNLLDEFVFDFWVENNMLLETLSLKMLHALKFYLGNIVSIHVHQDVLYHNDRQFNIFPDLVDFLDKIIITAFAKFGYYWLEQINGSISDTLIKYFSMFMQYQVISSSVKFLIAECACFFGINFMDSFSDSVPVLLC